MNGAITAFANNRGSAASGTLLAFVPNAGSSLQGGGAARAGDRRASPVYLSGITPSGSTLSRSSLMGGQASLLRQPRSRVDTRCFALPQLPPAEGESSEENVATDAMKGLGEENGGDALKQEPELKQSPEPTGHGAIQKRGFGEKFFKPLQSMSDSIRGQFHALTHHHKSDGPREDAPEYGRAMANHLPMALSALKQLGAAPDTLAAFESAYRQRTPLKDVAGQKTSLRGDPALVFGRRDYFLALRNTFKDYQASHGTDALLNLWVPKLTEGLSASAFHAVIRLGYALSENDTSEIVNALAFWASSYQSLGALDSYRAENPSGDAKISDVFEAVRQDPDLGGVHLSSQGIANRLGRVARLPGYDRLIENINQSGKFTLGDLREQSLNLFLHQPSFTTLHLITGAEGLAKVGDKVAAPQSLLQHYALALTNVYISRGAPALDESDKIKEFVYHNPQPDWPFLRTQAIESGDEHKIKFVHTCQSEFEKTGDFRYPLAAGVWLTGKQPWRDVPNDDTQAA